MGTPYTTRSTWQHRGWRPHGSGGRARQGGLSLVEVMVSLVIGIFVVGAVLMNFIGSGTTGRQQGSLSQLSEDAHVAFSMLARDLQMAGYSDPTGVAVVGSATTASFGRNYSGLPVFGCIRHFTDPAAATGAVACASSGSTATHSIEVNYEATPVNSLQTSGGVPTDCMGNALTISGTFYVASNRYYVTTTAATSRPELVCSSAGQTGQAVVENVQSMVLWYGLAETADSRRAVRYVKANNVTDWGTVVSVRVCLLMRSADAVLGSEDYATYTDCDGASVTPTDRRIYRAFFSTVALRNRAGF